MEIAYHRYGLKLLGITGANARSQRRVLEGFLIRADGGYGCVQPWPELGDGSLEAQWQALKTRERTPLLKRAFECAAADAQARQDGRSLFDGLRVPQSHATVTGVSDFAALEKEGFTTVKLKGGRHWPGVLDQMRTAVDAGLRVRVDFNGVLDGPSFREFSHAAEDVRPWVDFIEDPIPYNADGWHRLRHETGWRLALDFVRDGKEIAGGFDFRIWKPAVGGLGTRLDADPPVVVTSYMDHPVGQAFAAWEAGRTNCIQELAGLLTHRLFEPDAFAERLAAAGPDWTAPGGTGLGFDDLLEKLPWVSLNQTGPRGAGRVLQNPRDPLPDGGPVLETGQVGFATSGSTGAPSVVVHTQESLEASARAVNDWLGATAADVWLRVLPDFHVGGYQIGLRAGLSGARAITDEGKWDAGRFAKTCAGEAVTLSALVPAQVVDLVESGLRAPVGMRAVVVGGGALEVAKGQAAKSLGWPLLLSYGATEAGSQVATERAIPAGRIGGMAPAGTTEASGGNEKGEPIAILDRPMEVLPHWEARVAAKDAPGMPHEAGLLELRGPAMALGRFVRVDNVWLWHELRNAAGWWRTADRVILSGRTLRFVGRADRVVKVLGELVNLEAVEASLLRAGLVQGTFVIVAVPEARRGRELVLVVERELPPDEESKTGESKARLSAPEREIPWAPPGTAPADLSERRDLIAALECYTANAAPYARISRIVELDGLPRSPLGKVRMAEVAALIPPRATPG